MKKLALIMVTLLTSGAVYALPLGNPSDANLYTHGIWWCDSCWDPCDPCSSWCDAISLRLGFWGDYVFNRNLEVSNSSESGGDIQTTTIFRNEGLLVLNFYNYLDVFGTVGTSNFGIITPSSSFSVRDVESEVMFSPAVSYSVGLRVALWNCDCFSLGLESQWAGSAPRADYFIDYGNGILTYINSQSLFYSEWQVGFGGSYRFENGYGTAFIPYAGVKVAGANWSLNNTTFVQDGNTVVLRPLGNKKVWGYAVGVTATVNETTGIGVEGRWGDEKAVYANAEIRF